MEGSAPGIAGHFLLCARSRSLPYQNQSDTSDLEYVLKCSDFSLQSLLFPGLLYDEAFPSRSRPQVRHEILISHPRTFSEQQPLSKQ